MRDKKKSLKRAFTMIEIIFSIITKDTILSLSYSYYSQNKWIEAVNTLGKSIYFLADDGIMNPTTGYINSTGGNCSSDTSYTSLSAGRMLTCTGYASAYSIGGTTTADGTQSWAKNLLTQYMPSGKTCKLYMSDKDIDEYYLFLDCSDVNYGAGNNRAKKFLEQKINSYLKQKLPTIYQSVDFNSTMINNNNGGNDGDGMLRILMKK